MGWFSDKRAEVDEKDRKAHALRDAEMQRRKDKKDAEQSERTAGIMKEVEQIRQQAANKKKGLW